MYCLYIVASQAIFFFFTLTGSLLVHLGADMGRGLRNQPLRLSADLTWDTTNPACLALIEISNPYCDFSDPSYPLPPGRISPYYAPNTSAGQLV
jgi:hypothetical protein